MLIFEMITGYSPFYEPNIDQMRRGEWVRVDAVSMEHFLKEVARSAIELIPSFTHLLLPQT